MVVLPILFVFDLLGHSGNPEELFVLQSGFDAFAPPPE
jgi:hypothetical protein